MHGQQNIKFSVRPLYSNWSGRSDRQRSYTNVALRCGALSYPTTYPARCRLYPALYYHASERIKVSRSQTRLTSQPLVWFSPFCYLSPFLVA